MTPSRISLATENQLQTLPFLLISLHATITSVYHQDFWREVRKEEKDGWRDCNHQSLHQGRKRGGEVGTVNISPQAFSGAKGMMKAVSRSETADQGGYGDGIFHLSTNPYSGGPEQAAHRTGCMHGV